MEELAADILTAVLTGQMGARLGIVITLASLFIGVVSVVMGLTGIALGEIRARRAEHNAEAMDQKLDRMAKDLGAAVAATRRFEREVPPDKYKEVMESTGAARVVERFFSDTFTFSENLQAGVERAAPAPQPPHSSRPPSR